MCEWCEKRKVCLMCGKPLPKENELHPVRSNATWQPMKKAPRDRSVLLALNGRAWIASWDRDYRVWRDGSAVLTGNPCGWMDVPKVPNADLSSGIPHAPNSLSALEFARVFHDTYERLAPAHGYETRPETRAFDPDSPNGRLMTAVCEEIMKQHGKDELP